MDISLADHEIKQALADYVKGQGIDTTGKKIDITLKSGRKKKNSTESGGHSAIVIISDADEVDVTHDVNAEGEADGGSDSLFDKD